MGRENLNTGRLGERIAWTFLKRNGYRVIRTNVRTPFGEIDAVCEKGGVIVFIEIKTRRSDSLGPPFLSVTWAKQRRLIKNALSYLKWRRLLERDWRIDVVSVKLDYDYNIEKIELIENAVEDIT